MRISDWSSDVCSSDLRMPDQHDATTIAAFGERLQQWPDQPGLELQGHLTRLFGHARPAPTRAVERHQPGLIEQCRLGEKMDKITPASRCAMDKHHHRASRSEEHTSELQSLMRISYAVFCLKKKKTTNYIQKAQEKTTLTT